MTGGRQSGSAIAVQSGRLVFTGLAAKDQFVTIDADLAGPAADAVAVLRHPRLHLLQRLPIDLRDPSGTVAGHLTVTALPLEFNLSIDDLRIQSTGRLTRLHLTGIAAGRDLDQGDLDFAVNSDSLSLHGNALIGGIASQLQVGLDFRDGGPTQVLEKVSATATADARQLAAAGLDTAGLVEGNTRLEATVQERRNGQGDILVRADLAAAALALGGWISASPLALRRRPSCTSCSPTIGSPRIDRIRLDGDGIAVAGSLSFAGGMPDTLHFDRLKLGEATDVAGDLQFPRDSGEPWSVRMSGRSLDASAEFGAGERSRTRRGRRRGEAKEGEAAEERGPPWRVKPGSTGSFSAPAARSPPSPPRRRATGSSSAMG